jgi:hypothetical protein
MPGGNDMDAIISGGGREILPRLRASGEKRGFHPMPRQRPSRRRAGTSLCRDLALPLDMGRG